MSKGQQKDGARRERWSALLDEIVDHPRALREGIELPGGDELAVRFEARRRESEARGDQFTGARLSGRAFLRNGLKAAVLLTVFAAGFILGTGPFGRDESAGSPGTAALAEEGSGGETIQVRLVLDAPEAETVSVAADWNQWMPGTQPLHDDDGDGVWEIRLRLQRGQDYQYQFVIDGSSWIADPEARVQIDDGFGGKNSLLHI